MQSVAHCAPLLPDTASHGIFIESVFMQSIIYDSLAADVTETVARDVSAWFGSLAAMTVVPNAQ